MTNLFETFQDQDLGYLRIVAELWGVAEPAQSGPDGARELIGSILQTDLLLEEMYASLPARAAEAFDALLARSGSMPWTDFTREFGAVRQVGPGRRDRERHWRSPQSATEELWFRGLIGREFRDTATGPREYAYVPDEIVARLSPDAPDAPDTPTHSESPAPEPDRVVVISSRLVDDCVTILAALRQRPAGSLPLPPDRRQALAAFLFQPRALEMLTTLLMGLGALSPDTGETDPTPAGQFMTQERASALHQLGLTWRDSAGWNDLALVEHLEDPSGAWPNDSVATRASVLLKLKDLARGRWWETSSFIDSVRVKDPGFARPGGEFESWYLRDRNSGRFLRGIEHWEAIEGALLHRLIAGPLHWIGAVDLGSYASGERGLAFRLTDRFDHLLAGSQPGPLHEETAQGVVQSTGAIRLPRMVSREIRYGVARMSAWIAKDQDEFVYRLTPRALERAVGQGLSARHLQKLLEEAGGGAAPPALMRAVQAHAERGIRIELEHGMVVKVQDPDLMSELLADRRIASLIVERLGDRAALVRESQVERFLDACARQGILAQPPGPADSP